MGKQTLLEWSGVGMAILYSVLIALNIGAEFIGFSLLLSSALLIGLFGHILENIVAFYCFNFFTPVQGS